MVATLALYNPVNRHPFVNYDDDRYVTENPHVHNGVNWDTITWAFTAMEQGNWHPLTWLSHALDYQLFHQNRHGTPLHQPADSRRERCPSIPVSDVCHRPRRAEFVGGRAVRASSHQC